MWKYRVDHFLLEGKAAAVCSSGLHSLLCAGRTDSWWKELDKGVTVMTTVRKFNNSPVPQQMVKCTQYICRKHCCLFWISFLQSIRHCFLVLPECEDLFYTLYFLISLQTKVTVHFAYWELVLLQAGTRIFHDIFQQTHIWNRVALNTHAVEQCT